MHYFQVFFYSSGIYEKAGVEHHQIPYTVMGTNAVNVAMTIIAVSSIVIYLCIHEQKVNFDDHAVKFTIRR